MKLFKLSLVAALAAGAFSTASAVALEEAIKDVDVSGWAFVRYQASTEKAGGDGDWWKYKAIVNVKSKIDDNFFFLAGIRYGAGADKDTSTTKSTSVPGDGAKKFMLNQIYLGYNIGGTTIMAGRYTLGTFFTADMYGDGIKVVNTDIQGLTLAALFADALERDGDAFTLKAGEVFGKDKNKLVTDHNLYGVAAIGSYDPISFQVWYAYLEDVAGLFAVEAAAKFNVSDDFGIGVKGQFGSTSMKGEVKDIQVQGVNLADSKFAAGQASIQPFGFDLTAGYVYYKAKDDGLSLSSFEDNGGFISAGEVLVAQQETMSYSGYMGKNDYWFVKLGYKIPNTGVKLSADYLDGKFGSKTGRIKAKEAVARINYAYNKHLDFTTYYSHVKFDEAFDNVFFNKNDEKIQTVRVNARYKF